MSECPGTDALVTIADALGWDVQRGLQHLGSCPHCAQQLLVLESTHSAFEETEAVSENVVRSITDRIGEQAAIEQQRGRRNESIGHVVEAMLAGATALALLSGGGMNVDKALATAVFGAVAAGVLVYRTFVSSHLMASRSSSGSIQ